MFTKESLRADFAKNYEQHYKVKMFGELGFTRKKCPKCGKNFWSISKEDCGDSAHTEYSFFKKKSKAEKDDYVSFWKKFAGFFKKNGHAVVNRYPVVSRWRPDLYFTMASIQDFQRLEKGKMNFEYPANPLVVPQISLRFNDIANVGVTGRHFTCFTMAGQHAFNPPKEGYWKDECLRLNYEFLTGVLGVDKNELTYTEDVWAMGDFSAFGPCVESFANGLELVNSVFMQFENVEGKPRELPIKVIDVGWGLERLQWYFNGDYTAFDSVFPREIEFMEKNSKAKLKLDHELFHKYARISSSLDAEEVADVAGEERKIAEKLGITVKEMKASILPLQAIYAIADHARTLLFAIADGSLPSNVGGGYNLRVIFRRASSFISENDFDFSLTDIMRMEAEDVKEMYPELLASMPEAERILEVEERRFCESKEKARRIVSEMIGKGEKFDTKKMIQLYESNGITPELVEKVADEMKKDIRIPTDFYSKVTQKKFEKQEEALPIKTEGMPATRLLYYENKLECTSKIIAIDDKYIILDKTVFYPESGGQAHDAGKINSEKVAAVEKVGEVIVHIMAGKPKFRKGESVKCEVLAERREALRRHHSATHVVNAAARRVLGNHVWQAGARKEPERAHLDITHYEKITPQQLREIETVANRIVLENHPVTTTIMDRGEAEKKYGFTLYQGGGSPGKRIRVVDIAGIDAEACGGLHVTNTGQIGMIKIISESRIQDGINRLEFCAGEAAVRYLQEMEGRMAKTAEALRVPADQLDKTASRFFEEWKERGKKIETLSGELAKLRAQSLLCSEEEVVRAVLDVDVSTLKTLAQEFSKKGKAAVLANNENNVFCVGDSRHGANGLLAEVVKKFGGNGGGSEKFASGKTDKKIAF